jgi:putative transcriptional regulator
MRIGISQTFTAVAECRYFTGMPSPSLPAVRFRLAELLSAHKPEPMTQAELSRRSGINPVTINRIVNNRTRQVSLATLQRLAAALDCEPGDLLEGAAPAKGGRRR